MSSLDTTALYSATGAIADRRNGDLLRWPYFAGAMFLYKFVLDSSYDYLAFAYAYQNFFINSKTYASTILSWLMLIVALPAFKRVFDNRSASGNVLSLLILFSVIPTLSAISFRSDYPYTYIIEQSLFWAIFYMAWSLLRPVYFNRLHYLQSRVLYTVTLLALSVSVIIYSYINTGLRLHFDLIGVYDIRAEARGFIAPFPLNYLVSFADNLLPVLMVYIMTRKRWVVAAAIFFVIFLNFSISGQKQSLFVPALGFIGFFAFKEYIKTYQLLFASVIFTALCIAQTALTQGNTLHGLFTYRVLFIPTELHYSYYSYFQIHDILRYSQSILKSFSDPNSQNIQFLIGEYAIGEYTARANNGLFSDAYMNLGIVGVLIYPVVLALLLRIVDGAMEGLPKRMAFVVVIYVGFVLMSNTLTAALLTSGLIFLIFLLYSFPREIKLASTPSTFGSQQPTLSGASQP